MNIWTGNGHPQMKWRPGNLERLRRLRRCSMSSEANRIVKVSVIQQGPATKDKEERIRELLKQVEEVAQKEHPDFLLASELSTTQYFPAGSFEPKYFSWAEPIPGPTTERFGEKAKKYGICIILPMFEKSSIESVYYNSAAVI